MGYNYSSNLLYTLIIQAGSRIGTIAASVFGYHLPRKRVLTFGAFRVAFILAAGSAAGSLIPPVSGALLDTDGLPGVFGLAAFMYVVFAISIQFGPETYGKSMEDPNQPAEVYGSPGARAPEPA